jgi:hypothetical protein
MDRQRDEALRVATGGDETQIHAEAGMPSSNSAPSARVLPEPEPEPEQQLEPEPALNRLPRTASAASTQAAAADLSAAMVCTTDRSILMHSDTIVQTFRAAFVSVIG